MCTVHNPIYFSSLAQFYSVLEKKMDTVEFKIITESMFPDVCQFLGDHYFSREPVSRSLGISRSWIVDQFLWKDSMSDNSSIAALDNKGNMIGVRLGMRMSRPKWFSTFTVSLPFPAPGWYKIFEKLMEQLGYDTAKMFDKLKTDLIYEDSALCTLENHEIVGLEKELLRRTEAHAKELGCTHSYAVVTGMLNCYIPIVMMCLR